MDKLLPLAEKIATRLIERRNSTKWASSAIANASRSDGLSFNSSRIWLRSTPTPRRGSDSSIFLTAPTTVERGGGDENDDSLEVD